MEVGREIFKRLQAGTALILGAKEYMLWRAIQITLYIYMCQSSYSDE